jgi:hypothetical protein
VFEALWADKQADITLLLIMSLANNFPELQLKLEGQDGFPTANFASANYGQPVFGVLTISNPLSVIP